MIQQFKSSISRNLTNAKGWRSNRKIVVIESDDWGSIRMPNRDIYKKYKDLGYDIDSTPYCQFDTLANTSDLKALFEVLLSHTNNYGIHPKITFNTVVSNPKFDKIEQSNFDEYFYEPFTETLKRYYPDEDVFKVWHEGIEKSIISPQFHGREHVNIPLWLTELKEGNQPFLDAFRMGFWGIPKKLYKNPSFNIQAAFDSAKIEHVEFYKKNIIEGLKLFEDLFGFKSDTFIANNYIFPESLNATLRDAGIKGIQSMKYHIRPQKDGSKSFKEVFTGKVNELNQIYTVRNCVFEPSQMHGSQVDVSNCLSQIKQSFFWHKPAIITSHRLNFIGSLVPENRDRNLRLFDDLLLEILKKWPNVEFMSSQELICEIKKGHIH